jgi:hypothetical protein
LPFASKEGAHYAKEYQKDSRENRIVPEKVNNLSEINHWATNWMSDRNVDLAGISILGHSKVSTCDFALALWLAVYGNFSYPVKASLARSI